MRRTIYGLPGILYMWAVGIAGTFFLCLLTWRDGSAQMQHFAASFGDPLALVIALVTAFGLIIQLMPITLSPTVSFTLGSPVCVGALFIFGPVVTCWYALVTSTISRATFILPLDLGPQVEHPRLYKGGRLVFGGGMWIFMIYGGYFAYSELLQGSWPLRGLDLENLVRILATYLVVVLVNDAVLGASQYFRGISWPEFVQTMGAAWRVELSSMPVALLMVGVYGQLGLTGLVLLFVALSFAGFTTKKLAETRNKLQDRVAELITLNKIGTAIARAIHYEELLHLIYDEMRKILDASLFTIVLYNDATEELIFEFEVEDGVIQPKSRLSLGDGLNAWIVRHRRPLLIHSLEEEQRFGITSIIVGKPSESWLGTPMLIGERVIGVLSIQSYQKNAFREEHLQVLMTVAGQAAVAIENARLYQDLEQFTQTLELRVSERTHQLQEVNAKLQLANVEIQEANSMKTRFLASMSHELRTPLNSIIGFSEVLADRLVGQISERHLGFIRNVVHSGRHLLGIINDILDISKIEAGKMELYPQQLEGLPIIESLCDALKPLTVKNNIEIVLSVPPHLPPIYADESKFKQILYNLLSNAVKFSPPGSSVILAAQRHEPHSSPIGVECVSFAIADYGIGIQKQELDKIFTEFYQVEGEASRRFGGTGLGLTLTKKFVEMHGGILTVTSEPGTGSIFTFYLPLAIGAARLEEDIARV